MAVPTGTGLEVGAPVIVAVGATSSTVTVVVAGALAAPSASVAVREAT
jgi:hypothetical protein